MRIAAAFTSKNAVAHRSETVCCVQRLGLLPNCAACYYWLPAPLFIVFNAAALPVWRFVQRHRDGDAARCWRRYPTAFPACLLYWR